MIKITLLFNHFLNLIIEIYYCPKKNIYINIFVNSKRIYIIIK